MKGKGGVTMNAATPCATLAVILYLVTVLEATYLERPLWVADKGRQQFVSFANDESRVGQFQEANGQAWIISEQYYPQRSGVENQHRPQESPNAAHIVREERPPLNSFLSHQEYDEWNPSDTAYEYQTKNQAQSMTNGQSQSAWLNHQQQQQPAEYQNSFISLEPSKLQPQPEPEPYDAYGQQGWNWEAKPENAQLINYQSQFQSQENYPPYRTDSHQPKPSAEAKPERAPLNNYQPQFQAHENYQPYRTDLYQPKPSAEAKPENAQLSNYHTQFQTQESYKPYRTDLYQPKPDAETQMSFNQPKPGTFKPNQPNVEPFPSNPEAVQQNFPPKRPQEVQQNYHPYSPRPELYQPSPSFVEPEYQVSYYGQQALPSFTGSEMQMPDNKQPTQQTSKPIELPNKVKNPTNQPENQFEQAPLTNSGYYPYQSQEPWSVYQQNPTEEIQASGPSQAGPDTRVGDNMSVYQLPSLQGSYGRELVVENLKPVDRVAQQQEIRKPTQPLRTEQWSNRPMEEIPEEPKYQLNRVPPTSWETQNKPQQAPAVPKPKPQPQQRPSMIEPIYNRRPEQYNDDDDEVVVKYDKPVTRFDTRCPRDDDPAKPVHFPSTTSCAKFQKCFNGIAYEMSCPPGLEFDATNSRCDYPARARCSV